jgi:phosphoglycerate dehydrogenase-like enzyme
MAERLRILTHLPPGALARVTAEMPDVELIEVPAEGDPPGDVTGSVLLTYAWGSPNLGSLVERGVEWIHTIGTGVDRFPFDALGGRTLTCARGATSVPIAEWVLTVMLAYEKRLPGAWITAPPERWNRFDLGTLQGRRLGLVGLGTIAQQVATRAFAFDMRVSAYRRTATPSPIAGVEVRTELKEVAAESDHLVVAAAATPETRHLVGREVLSAVKPGAHLVNVARGSLVDQDALRVALDEGRIACASLDTVEPEPLPDGHWMYTHPKVRLSPHISWNMPGAVEQLFDSFLVNLRLWRAGEPLLHVVDVEARY